MTVIDYILQADASGMLTALGKTEKALKDVDTQADKTRQTTEKTTKTMGERFEHAGSKMVGFGKTMTLGVTAPLTAAFGVMTAKAAEDAEAQEILTRNLHQMAGASDEAVSGAEDYIKQLSLMSGVADDELRPALSKLVSATGDVGKAQDLLSLALDASVSKGKPLEAVSQALARAYMGSTGALGKLGIATKDAEGKALSFSQIQASLKTQVDGAAKAAGETGAGGWRRFKTSLEELQESLGEKLLPFFGTLANVGNTVLGWFDALGPAGSNAAVGLGLAAIALGPIATGIGTIMKNATGIIGWFKSFGAGAAAIGAHSAEAATGIAGLSTKLGGLAGIGKGIGVAAIIAGITLAIDKAATATDRFKAQWSDAFEHGKQGPTALLELSQQLKQRWEELLSQSWFRQFWSYWFGDMQGVVSEMQRVNDALAITDDVTREVAGSTGATAFQIRKLADAMHLDLGTGSDEAKTKIKETALAILSAGGDLQTFITGSGEAKQALLAVAEKAGVTGSAFGDLGDAAADTVDPLDELKKAIDGIFDPVLNWDEAKATFAELGLEMDKLAQDANTKGLERSLAAQRIARDVIDSYKGMMSAAVAQGASEADQRKITQQHIDTLAALGRKFPEVKGVADGYIKTLKSTPGDLLTNARMTAPKKFADDYKAALDGIDGDRITTLRLKYADAQDQFMMRLLIARDLGITGAQAVKLAKVGALARGGPVSSGMVAMVGEEGPELVTFGAAGRVHDAATTQRIMNSSSTTVGGSTVVVNVHVGNLLSSKRELVQAVEDGFAQVKRQSGTLAFLN